MGTVGSVTSVLSLGVDRTLLDSHQKHHPPGPGLQPARNEEVRATKGDLETKIDRGRAEDKLGRCTAWDAVRKTAQIGERCKTVAEALCSVHRIVGLVVKASASRVADPGFESRERRGIFPGRVMPVT